MPEEFEIAEVLTAKPESELDKHFDEAITRYLRRKGRIIGTAIILLAALITAMIAIVTDIKTILGWIGISLIRM